MLAEIDNREKSLAFSPINARVILNIRWLAIFGQLAALLYTYFVLKFNIPIGPALFVISLSVAMNVWQTRRINITSDRGDQTFLALAFDVLQLAMLLYFTGGLLNPFSILFLAPVFVSAAILRRPQASALVALVVICVSSLAVYNVPLPWDDVGGAISAGKPIHEQQLYLAGLWLALLLSAVFIGVYAWWVASGARKMSEELSNAKLAFASEQQIVALGALATAAAHKLGSPLNTITVITHELEREIHKIDPIYEDIQLLRSEAERCRIILRELDEYKLVGDADSSTEIPLRDLLQEILDERIGRNGIFFSIKMSAEDAQKIPLVRRRPEIVQALDDVFRNAETFARKKVAVTVTCSEQNLKITVVDDGAGFSDEVLQKAGQPWNSTRYGTEGHRGLGIFISQTLIELVGGSILFRNKDTGGGEVQIFLPMATITSSPDA